MAHYTFTYDVVTPESAEDGDTADNGFYVPGGWDRSLCGDDRDAVITAARAGKFDHKCERGWIKDAWDIAGPFSDVHVNDLDVTGVGYPNQDYQSGAWTTLSVHVKCPTAASAERVARALKKGRA